MGRAPCCDKANVKKGPWSPEEDAKLKSYIEQHGTGGNWIALPQKIGLKRCGKSCRLRWLNYLRPNIKHGGFSEEEDNIICSLYVSIGSRWSIIAAQLPGRTDNDIKNYWNTRLKKKLLGKQRKEQQAHVGSSMKQDMKMKRETENFMVSCGVQVNINQPPYWPQQYSIPLQHYDLNNPSTGITFSLQQQDHQQSYTNTITPINSQDHNPVDMMSKPSNIIFQGFENLTNDLSELLCVNPQQMEGFYGMESMDISNGSTITTSTESTNWGDMTMTSLVYSPLVSDYEGYPQGIPQDVAFEKSRYF